METEQPDVERHSLSARDMQCSFAVLLLCSSTAIVAAAICRHKAALFEAVTVNCTAFDIVTLWQQVAAATVELS